MSDRYTSNKGIAGAISVTPCNDSVQNRRKRVFHLFNCLICGRAVSVETKLKQEREYKNSNRWDECLHTGNTERYLGEA
jgi:hypothetical protein